MNIILSVSAYLTTQTQYFNSRETEPIGCLHQPLQHVTKSQIYINLSKRLFNLIFHGN